MKTFVIGDIHGAYKALVQCLERSKFDKDKDMLIVIGDIADGWSQVPECVDELLTIRKRIDLKGNHDFWLNQWLEYGVSQRGWREQGGQATIDAYIRTGKLTEQSHRDYFRKQLFYYIDDKNRAFVHAGFMKGLGKDDNNVYIWDRSLWSHALLYDRAGGKSEYLSMHEEIYIGHTATVIWDTMEPMNARNVWNLDTGAGWHGKLTIMDIDTKKYWQSDLTKELYPNEKGRG